MEKFWRVVPAQRATSEESFPTENVALAEAKRKAVAEPGEAFYVLEAVAEVVGKVETEVKKLS